MENQEGSENVPRWENMNKDILSNIFKKLDVVSWEHHIHMVPCLSQQNYMEHHQTQRS